VYICSKVSRLVSMRCFWMVDVSVPKFDVSAIPWSACTSFGDATAVKCGAYNSGVVPKKGRSSTQDGK
jgi:hypothetical protein